MATTTGTLGVQTAVIKAKNLDVKNGVDLDLKPFQPAEAAMAVALKRVDVGIYAPISAVTANNEDKAIVLIAPLLWNIVYVIVAKDSPYKKVQDLKGKKVAVAEKISSAYTSSQVVFKELGMDFEKDFQVVTGPPPVQAGLLQKKDVEAAMFSDPWALQLIASGDYRQLAWQNDIWKELTGQPMFFIGLGTYRDWVNQNRETARRLLKTFTECAKYIQDHPEVIEEVKDSVGLKTPQEVELAKKRMPEIFATEWNDKVIKNAQLIVDRSVDLKIVPKAPAESIFVMP
ncbi:MAG: ABC transporter substrate-binding protein [Chloroflexi bacterium]|nr:ABC transporter substrate-binding protein [Chloroflexota bacterium]